MPEEIRKNLYRVPVPLPGNPLKELNSYVIKGSDRTLVVDTGFRQEPCRRALFSGLRELGVHPEETDVLLTHLHSDHSGLSAEVAAGEGRHIYVGDVDRRLLEKYAQVQRSGGVNQKTLLRRAQGFTEEELSAEGRSNPAVTMAPPVTDNYKSLFDGDVISCGGYRLRCIQVPGHTPGQMCYWLEEEGAMLLGDHVLFDITPNITNWEGVDDSLGNYLDSLRAIRAYDVALPLPGHRGRGAFRARIDDLLAHHEHRLAEALEVVKKYPGNTAYFLAGHMTWKIRANSWEEFPLAQKWFAVGECASHMDYLKRRDLIREEPDGEGLLRYYPC